MKVQFHMRSGGHHATYDIEGPITTAVLDDMVRSKTEEFLALINEPDDNPLSIPPAWQLPVMRSGRIRR